MALGGWCGRTCSECMKPCKLDQQIPCSPDCKCLTRDGKIHIADCLKSGCDEIKWIFDMVDREDQELLEKYGTTAQYPY